MTMEKSVDAVKQRFITAGDHEASDYFAAIKELVHNRSMADNEEAVNLWQSAIDEIYTLVDDELINNTNLPKNKVKFGTSGWRGILGKDIFLQSVAVVTCAVVNLFKEGDNNPAIADALGGLSFTDMQQQGCVIGFDNRFGGEKLALAAVNVLAANGIKTLYAGESTTGALSALVLQQKAAFSINLTPSHNPLEYGGFKFNAADAGPAAPVLTDTITAVAAEYLSGKDNPYLPKSLDLKQPMQKLENVVVVDALEGWQQQIDQNKEVHGIDYRAMVQQLASRDDIVVCVDAVHGASRDYTARLLGDPPPERLVLLRNSVDPTFGGIAPEPSSKNMQPTMQALASRPESLKIGAIIDPDGDRIRFTDGAVEISMNQFGAMAYHFLHEFKQKKGMVAKTVASSNLANAVATRLGEEVFEPKVGFKEFKPVMGKALVFFEESDGISIIGHTPEKDAFIGLILAIDMVITLNISLGEYLKQIEEEFGAYYPDRDGLVVAKQGEELLNALKKLEVYMPGSQVTVGEEKKTITEVIDIDGRKMILEDGSWIMIRPSGTEPKVRFYVEARDPQETALLTKSAHSMLAETGVLT